jgi:hypothetical protein
MDTKESFWRQCKPKMIPDISDEDLETMMKIIKPVCLVCEDGLPESEGVSGEGSYYREIITQGVDRRDIAFNWGPSLGRPVQIYRGGLNDIQILTFHTWAYYGFFKPTLAEVYACIRQFVPDWSKARFFWLDTYKMDGRNIIGDYHWSPCVLFGEEQNDVIDLEWDAFVRLCEKEKFDD